MKNTGEAEARVWVRLTMCLFLFASQAHTGPAIELPADLAKYRSWQQLLNHPYPVPMELWMRCAPPTAADWEAARKRSGPHTQRFIMVYANTPVAPLTSKRPFVSGTIIAKEKLLQSGAASPEGVAFMVKRQEPEFRDTGGWEFLYFPTAGDKQRTHERCASCHRNAASRDYVFGDYPRQPGWAPWPPN